MMAALAARCSAARNYGSVYSSFSSPRRQRRSQRPGGVDEPRDRYADRNGVDSCS
jgi:hypothetical protein